jgi:hypothetical protein
MTQFPDRVTRVTAGLQPILRYYREIVKKQIFAPSGCRRSTVGGIGDPRPTIKYLFIIFTTTWELLFMVFYLYKMVFFIKQAFRKQQKKIIA